MSRSVYERKVENCEIVLKPATAEREGADIATITSGMEELSVRISSQVTQDEAAFVGKVPQEYVVGSMDIVGIEQEDLDQRFSGLRRRQKILRTVNSNFNNNSYKYYLEYDPPSGHNYNDDWKEYLELKQDQ
eukprot:gb/GECG01014434.1/.p1 GENE.gb/GECG01014434.1/~~gb/GECG01014434.1/.p1  ORF type:complete len:132 (+),score=21.51 gb/GECG01014434.1/:1-396(+)